MAIFEPDLLRYENDVKTIADVINEGDAAFAIVVKTCGSFPDHVGSGIRKFDLPENTEILLQRQFKGEFAHVKVLPFYDNKVMEKEYGPEYVLEHESYVGKEYLLPLSYGGNIKSVQRPGSTGIYKNISQVITNGQGIIQLTNNTEAMSANDPSKKVVVKAKSRLKVKRKFHEPEYMNMCLIECSDGKMSYVFKEDDCVDCTAVDDNKTHNLIDVKKCNIFPRVIQFVEKVNPEMAVLRDREMNSAMQGIMEGPLELSGLEEREFLIGTVRDTLIHYHTHTLRKKKFKTFVTVLIPKHLWTKIFVKKQVFTCSEEKEKYIKRKYEQHSNISFVDKCLYFVPSIQESVVWLANPALYKPTLDHGFTVFDVILIPLEASSDDESEDEYKSGDYCEILDIKPPVPKRISTAKNEKKHPVLKRIQSWTDKIMKTLSLSGTETPPERPPKPDFSLPRQVRHKDSLSEKFLNGNTISELFAKDLRSHDPKRRVPPKRSQSEPAYPSHVNDHIYSPLVFDDPSQTDAIAEKDLLENILQSLSFESEIISLKFSRENQSNVHDLTATNDDAKLENEVDKLEKSFSLSRAQNIEGDFLSFPSKKTEVKNSLSDKARKQTEQFSFNVTKSSFQNNKQNLNCTPPAIVATPLEENEFTNENGKPMEIGCNYDTISDDVLDNSVSSNLKSANNDKHNKMVKKSFLHTSIETSKINNIHSCTNGNQHRVPDENNKEDDNGEGNESVMVVQNRDKVKHRGQGSHSLNEKTTSQARKSFLHSNLAVTCVETSKGEKSKARSDMKANAEKGDNDNVQLNFSLENLKPDNINIQIIELNERDIKEPIESKPTDIKKRTASKINMEVRKRPNTSLSKEQQQQVLKDNQTESDFYSYTAAETAFCFKMCGLQKLADFCFEERVDGSFFKKLDSDLLVFCHELGLSKFNIYTLKSIIREGYRKTNVMI